MDLYHHVLTQDGVMRGRRCLCEASVRRRSKHATLLRQVAKLSDLQLSSAKALGRDLPRRFVERLKWRLRHVHNG